LPCGFTFRQAAGGMAAGGTAAGGTAVLDEGNIEDSCRRRLDASLEVDDTKQGLGLGLNLAYGLVRALGGELCFESEPGSTCFYFEIPAHNAREPELAEVYVAEETPSYKNLSDLAGGGKKVNWDTISRTISTSESQSSDSFHDSFVSRCVSDRRFVEPDTLAKQVSAAAIANEGLASLEAPHILVVEDTEMCADVLRMLLKKLGCSSDHAKDGAAALEMLMFAEPGFYSLILMDLRMPVMDGFAATKAIKRFGETMPVIALTADMGFDTRDKCMRAGFDDFATKPMHATTLASLLEKHASYRAST